MKLFLIIIAIMCYSVVNKAAEDDYEVKSVCCDKLENSEYFQRCQQFDFWFWKELCQYDCDECGDLRVFNCTAVFHFASEISLCKDLYCETKNETTPDPRDIAQATSTTPQK